MTIGPIFLVADVEVVVCEAASLASQNVVSGIGLWQNGGQWSGTSGLVPTFE